MAITNYLRLCDYQIGGLKPFIYLIDKSALKLNIKAKGIEVFFEKRKEGDVKKIDAQLCIYTQEETYSNKFRFNSTLQVTVNEQYEDPFLYGLKDLRLNKYYIIIEDKKGTQYLVNPELFTKFTYEYTFVDGGDNYNSVVLTFVNLSNYPLLIFKEKIESNVLLFGKKCDYNLAKTVTLVMSHYEDLKVNDDGVKCDEIYVDDIEYLKKVEFMKETFNLKETYDGSRFQIEMSFSIPLSNHKFEWAYDLIEFQKNKYKALIHTTNNNYILVGNEKGLFPSYTIQTSEDDETPNLITFKFTHMSQYPVVFTDEIHQYRWVEDEQLCFGFDKYQMLRQQISKDWGQSWEDVQPIVKKKGELIEADSEDCKEYRWVDDEMYCATIGNEYYKWIVVDGFICEYGSKYERTQKYYSTDNVKYVATDEYAKGNLIETNSKECMYAAIRWVEDTSYVCFEVNEDLTRWTEQENVCVGDDLYRSEIEEVTNNGITYHPSGKQRNGVLVEENCCECGYRETEYRKSDRTICGYEIGDSYNQTSRYEIWEEWEFCPKDPQYDKLTGKLSYRNPQADCACGYTGVTYVFEGETICGDEIDKDASKYYEVWVEKDVCTNEPTGNFSYRNPKDRYEWIFEKEYICGSEIGSEYEQTSNYEVWKKYDHCSKTYVETDYRNPQSDCDCGYRLYEYRNSNRTICGSEIGEEYEQTSKYEIWEEWGYCPTNPEITELTGKVEYRNPVPSYDCGLVTYEWRLEDTNVCGNALPEGTTETNTPPTNND